MAKPRPAKPNTPAAPTGAADAASAAGNQSSQVGAGKQPAGSSLLPAGSAPTDHVTEIPESESGTQQRAAGDGAQAGAVSDGDTGGARAGLGEITQDLRVHSAAVQANIPTEVLCQACAPRPEITDVIAAREYPDRWVLVVLTATRAFKVEVSL